MKKIVYIAQSAGGVAEYLYMLLSNIGIDKYENILIVSDDYREQIERFKNLNIKIYFVPMIRDIKLKSDLQSIIKVKKILKNEKPDIVYLHSSKAGAIGRIALLFNKKIKIIYNAHGWAFNSQIGSNPKKYAIIEKILAINTDKIINISKSEYKSAIENKIANKNKMCIIENGIDFKKFENCEKYREKTRKKYNIDDNEILIGVVGRISEQKDPITSLNAFKLINEKYKNTKFMFVGSGELEQKVKEWSVKNKLEKQIIITGWINKVEEYIPAFDIAILPSKWEGFGLAIVEYMACKKPIVATKTGGIQDIICDGKKGILIEKEKAFELYKGILKCIDDKEMVEKLISNNYEYAYKNFNIRRVVYKHEKIFES